MGLGSELEDLLGDVMIQANGDSEKGSRPALRVRGGEARVTTWTGSERREAVTLRARF